MQEVNRLYQGKATFLYNDNDKFISFNIYAYTVNGFS